MPGSSGEKLCPICDSPLQPGSRKCSFCGTDLTIFDMEVEKPTPAQLEAPAPASRPSIESRVREVLSTPSRPVPPREPVPEPKRVIESAPTAASLVSEPEPVIEAEAEPVAEEEAHSAAETPVETEPHEYFACPECGAKVEVHAKSCSGCGVMFAEEGTEMFQCPACNTLVNIDSTTCPGCGAMFVESEEEAAASQEPPARAQEEIEAPISEVKTPPKPMKSLAPEPSEVQEAEPEPVAAEEPEEKKGRGAFGWFKKRKKESEATEPIGERIPGLASTSEEPERIPEPQLETRVQAQPPVRAMPEPVRTDAKDKGKDLARMVAEMKPILTLANEKDIDISESKRLIDEAAEAGRDRQLEKALEFVNRSRAILMRKIDDHLASVITQLREETGVAKDLGGDVSRALTYIGEIERARVAGDAEAAFVYVDKVSNELLPITGRYKEAKNRTATLKSLVADCETLILDTKEARTAIIEASKAFEENDFDRVEMMVKQATDRLYRAIPDRINEEMHAAKSQLIEAKMKNVNTTPMITILKSVRTLMKAGDYQQALREMTQFKEQMRKVM